MCGVAASASDAGVETKTHTLPVECEVIPGVVIATFQPAQDEATPLRLVFGMRSGSNAMHGAYAYGAVVAGS